MIKSVPDTTELSERAEVGTLQFVYVVMETITAFDEVWNVRLYRQLDLHDQTVVELHIN